MIQFQYEMTFYSFEYGTFKNVSEWGIGMFANGAFKMRHKISYSTRLLLIDKYLNFS